MTVDRVLEMVGPRAEASASFSRGHSALTRFANSRIHQNHAEDTVRVSLRVVVDTRASAASTTRTDDESLRALVERTLAAARLRPPDPEWPGLAPPAPATDPGHFDAATADATPDDRAEVVRAFVQAGPGLDAAGFCSTSWSETVLANSSGQRLTSRTSVARVDGVHRGDGADGSGSATSVRIGDLDGAAAGAIAAAKSRDGRDQVDVDPGAWEVVFEPACVANMLSFLGGSGFNARSVQDGTSFVTIGNSQFDESVSLWDDAADPRTLGPAFDGEGTPRRRVDLVKDGVTSGVVHSRRTAAKVSTTSTGHGGTPGAFGASPSNLFFGAGTKTRQELIADVARGLLVTEFNYTRILDPKTQVVTGLTRNGTFLIENGAVTKPVRNLRFTQSYVAALGPGRVLGIGNDARLQGASHVPSVRLASWNFTGGARG